MGIVYDTASVALMHALAAAREIAASDTRRHGLIGRHELRPLRVYTSDQAHSSVEKAMIVREVRLDVFADPIVDRLDLAPRILLAGGDLLGH